MARPKKKVKIHLSIDAELIQNLKKDETNISALTEDLLFYYLYFTSEKSSAGKSLEELKEKVVKSMEKEKILEKLLKVLTALNTAIYQSEKKIDEFDAYVRTL